MEQALTTRVTFTLDLEDHRPVRTAEERYPAITRRCSSSSPTVGVRGTFFVTGEIAEDNPGLVRDVAGQGHELAFHGFHHVPFTQLEPDQLREEAKRAKGLLEDLGGREVGGFRAPQFSLVPESHWAIEVLGELGFTYSSSVLPARSPLFGDPDAPAARSGGRTGWSSCRARSPASVASGSPTSVACTCARCPPSRIGRRPPVRRRQLLWIYMPSVRLRRERAVLGGARGRPAR